eukprot:TRINITY_DN10479_c0_g1_i1.p1 TRINITY_DN10479_c0_g1~~TRINITY_DN10479_c0_g1_i1.p1  ORF type:complete len:125 (+),score=10.99 TRINITY_DN10479_c0_g1_i1:345-719(+)
MLNILKLSNFFISKDYSIFQLFGLLSLAFQFEFPSLFGSLVGEILLLNIMLNFVNILNFSFFHLMFPCTCLLYTSDAADDTPCVDLGGRRIIKKKKLPNSKARVNPHATDPNRPTAMLHVRQQR